MNTGLNNQNMYVPVFQCNFSTSTVYNMYDVNMTNNMYSIMNSYCFCDVPNQTCSSFQGFGHHPYESYGSSGDSSSSQKGCTKYEDHMFYSKNDINLKLLKDFNYGTRSEVNESGKSYTVYMCRFQG